MTTTDDRLTLVEDPPEDPTAVSLFDDLGIGGIDDLLDLDDDGPGGVPVPDPGGPSVDAARTLGWAVDMSRRLARIEAKRAKIAGAAQEQVDLVEAWAAEKDAPLRVASENLRALLVEYVRAERDRTRGRVKSLDTPWARVTTREAGGGWEWTPEAVAWAEKAHPEWVKRPDPSFDLAAAKRTLKAEAMGIVDPATGDVVPGLSAKPKTVTADVDILDGGGRG